MKKFVIYLFAITFYSYATQDTPLVLAAEGTKKGKETIAYFCKVVDLIEKGVNVNEPGAGGFTPLMKAALGGFLNVVEYLIAKGANVNVQDTLKKETALMKIMMKSWGTIKKEDPEEEEKFTFLVKMLLEAGADPNIANANGETPLVWASTYDLKGIIKLLLHYGASTTVKTKEEKSISDFASAEVMKFIKQTLSNDFNQALKDRDFVTIKNLIDAGVDINKFDVTRENNAIIVASKEGDVQLVEFLISKGADLNAQGAFEKEAALYVAIRGAITPQLEKKQEYYKIVEKLLKAKANPNIQNAQGSTPLMFAAAGSLYEFMKLLIDFDANKEIKNNQNQRAFELASDQGIEILKTYKKKKKKIRK